MSGGLWILAGMAAWFVCWFAYRWVRPSVRQHQTLDLAAWVEKRREQRAAIMAEYERGVITAQEAYAKLLWL